MPDFHRADPGRETGNLTSSLVTQFARVSEFQVLTRPQMHGSGAGEGAILNVRFRGRSCRSLDGYHHFGGDYCTTGFGHNATFPRFRGTS